MNYILIMTEGSTELALINDLIDRQLLKFSRKDLLYEEAYHKRQLDSELITKINMLSPNDKVDIFRVGDQLTDKLATKKVGFNSKRINRVLKVSTLPEFEILFILNEKKYKDFEKTKKKPSEFYKSINKAYNKQKLFVENYFSKMSDKEICDLLKNYDEVKKKTHSKEQMSLKDLLK